MRYVVIGAGAIGGTIGGRLAQAGLEVVLVARGKHLAALRGTGLRLVDPDGARILGIPAVGGPEEVALTPGDVLVLTVKSQDSLAALATWGSAPVEGGGTAGERLPLLCAQNGVENERFALRSFRSVYGVCVWLPAVHLQPGHVAVRSAPVPGVLDLGRYPEGVDDLIMQVARDLSGAGFSARACSDVMRSKYGKLLRNLGNAVDAVVAPGPGAEDLRARAVAEGVLALRAAGIAVTSAEEEDARRSALRVLPVAGLDGAGSSSWQSLVKGSRSIEADYLNGEIALLGRLHGVATPVNLALQELANGLARQGAPPRSVASECVERRISSAFASGAPSSPRCA